LQPACYDLLATESRTAVFAAIAKEDVPQESWFLLGRGHTLEQGRPVLLSMDRNPVRVPDAFAVDAVLTQHPAGAFAGGAVSAQQAYTAAKNIPWGISESAYYKMDEAGKLQYQAFGLPHLALHNSEPGALVISPYSTFLSLSVDPSESLRTCGGCWSWAGLGVWVLRGGGFTPSRRTRGGSACHGVGSRAKNGATKPAQLQHPPQVSQ